MLSKLLLFYFIIYISYIYNIYAWDQISKYDYQYKNVRINQYFETPTIYDKLYIGRSTSTVFLNNSIYVNSYDTVYSLHTNFSIHWKFIINSTITSNIYVSKNILSFGTYDNNLYVLHLDGTINYIFQLNNTFVKHYTFIDDEENIYFNTNNNVIYKIKNNNILWKINNNVDTYKIIMNPIQPYNDYLYLFQSTNIKVVNRNNLELIWENKNSFGFNGYFPAFDNNGILYISDTTNYNYAFHPNGTILWKSPLEYITYNSLLLSPTQTTLYFCTENNYIYALNTTNGNIIYKKYIGATITQTLSLSPDGYTLYGGGWYGNIIAINTETGIVKWKYKLNTQFKGSSAISDDGKFIYYVGAEGYLYKILTSCQEYITNCKNKTTLCDTVESIDFCPLHNCNPSYYNHFNYPKCTECPIICNPDQYSICDENGNNAQCINKYNITSSWQRFYGNNQQLGVYWNSNRTNDNYDQAMLINTFETNGYIRASPVIGNNLIYFQSYDGYVYSLYNNLALHWKTNINGFSLYNNPCLSHDNNFLYVITFDGVLYKLDALNGNIIWNITTNQNTYSSPAINKNNFIYINVGDGTIRCYDDKTNLIWMTQFNYEAAYTSITFNDDESILYISDSVNTLYGINSYNGNIIWSYNIENGAYSTIYYNNSLIVTTTKDHFIFNQNGLLINKITTNYYTYWGCIVNTDLYTMYCNGDKTIYAVDLNSFTFIWRYETENNFDSSPILSPDGTTIYNINLAGYLYGIRNDGTLKFRFTIPNNPIIVTTPAISSDGFNLYFGGDNNMFYNIRITCPKGNNCVTSSPYCKTKEDNNYCFSRKCEDGYYNDLYEKSICLPCPTPDNCKYNIATKCNFDGTNSLCPIGLCVDGYYNDQNSICTKCPAPLNCQMNNATKCIINGLNSECPLGYCNKGYYNLETSGICLKCPQNKLCLTESESCDAKTGLNPQCPISYCQTGYYNNKFDLTCKLCDKAEFCKVNYTSGCDETGKHSICPLKLCVDGYYNEGTSANGKCTKCPSAYMCSTDTILCGIDGNNPLCPAKKCLEGYTNNNMDSTCIVIPRQYSSTQIGIFVSVGGLLIVIIITLLYFRNKIVDTINRINIYMLKNKFRAVWTLFKGIILPIITISTSTASYINLLDRPVIYRYDLVNVYSVFIVISFITTIISVVMNIYLVLRIVNEEKEEDTLKNQIRKDLPSILQLFTKNIPMIIINNILIMKDNQNQNISDNIYFITITINAITLGINISSLQRLFETYIKLREKRGILDEQLIETQEIKFRNNSI